MTKMDTEALLLAPCSTKRKRKGREGSSSVGAAFNNFSLDNLEDDLLIEILLRLPTAESVFRSKLVCRRWCFLTSTRYFITQFITHHTSYYAAYTNTPSVFFTKGGDPRLCFFTDDDDEPPLGFSLEFLPEERNTVSIVASCNDLLFCQARSELDYSTAYAHNYICNPFTKQWLLLSPPPRRETFSIKKPWCFFGLVCEPNYQRWAVQGRQQYESRFRVLRFTPIAAHDGFMDVYCSETGQWNESFLSGKKYSRSNCNVVAYDGKLHWYTGAEIVAYDPFNHGQMFFIDASEFRLMPLSHLRESIACYSAYLGVSQGSLRLMRLATYLSRPSADHLSVWELDYETRRLCLTHKIFVNSMTSEVPVVPKILRASRHVPRAIAFHPDDKDVVYLGSRDAILSCKIQSGELDFASFLPYGDLSRTGEEVFPIALPWWPTLVSMRP